MRPAGARTGCSPARARRRRTRRRRRGKQPAVQEAQSRHTSKRPPASMREQTRRGSARWTRGRAACRSTIVPGAPAPPAGLRTPIGPRPIVLHCHTPAGPGRGRVASGNGLRTPAGARRGRDPHGTGGRTPAPPSLGLTTRSSYTVIHPRPFPVVAQTTPLPSPRSTSRRPYSDGAPRAAPQAPS